MAELIRRHGAPTYSRTRNSFHSLARAIIYQQLNGTAARTIYNRVRALFPGRAFPTPAQLAEVPIESLRAAGLSQAKATYLKDLARHFSEGLIQPRHFGRMSDEQIADLLTQVRGIGQWSVDMFLMFGLNRPDVLPVGDYAVQKGMAIYFDEPGPLKAHRMVDLAEPWRPFRSIACWYLWRVSESGL
jgi:3-methyladenine DNA glycosylase/8-oxoguanine DNA glycosylase